MNPENQKRGEWVIEYNVSYDKRPTKRNTVSIYHVGEMDNSDAREIVSNFLALHKHRFFVITSFKPKSS